MFREIEIENLVTIISAGASIIVLISSYLFPSIQTLLLTILTVSLPVIYQVGYNIAKDIIKNKESKTQKELHKYLLDGNKENELLKYQLEESQKEIELLVKNKKNSDKIITELEKSLKEFIDERKERDREYAEAYGLEWDENAEQYLP